MLEQYFAIGSRLRIGYNLLVSPAICWLLRQAHRSEIQSVQERSIIEGVEAERATGIKQIEHAVGGGPSLLNGGIPLPDDTHATRQSIGCLKHITGGVNVRSAGAHSLIDLYPSPAGDATRLYEVYDWLDTNGDNHHITGNTRAACSHNASHLSVFAGDLGYLFFKTHLNAITPLLLENKVGSGSVEYLRPEHMVAQKVGDVVATVAQRFNSFQGQGAASAHNHTARRAKPGNHSLVV